MNKNQINELERQLSASIPGVLTDDEVNKARETIAKELKRAGIPAGPIFNSFAHDMECRVYRDYQTRQLMIRVDHPRFDKLDDCHPMARGSEWFAGSPKEYPVSEAVALLVSRKSPEEELRRRRAEAVEAERKEKLRAHDLWKEKTSTEIANAKENLRVAAWRGLTVAKRAAIKLGDGKFTAMELAEAMDTEQAGHTLPPAGWVPPSLPDVPEAAMRPASPMRQVSTFSLPGSPSIGGARPSHRGIGEAKITTEQEIVTGVIAE